MDGKLLIFCDEIPNDAKKDKVRDYKFLAKSIIDPDDDPERIFINWDSIVPEDRGFIEECKKYARTLENPPANFPLTQRGYTNPSSGTIKGSLEEESYYDTYISLINRLRTVYEREGYEAMRNEALELGIQYSFEATQVFLENLSSLFNQNGIVRILPAFSNKTDINIVNYRKHLLESWVNANAYFRNKKSSAEVLNPIFYDEFGEVISKSGTELMKIYSLPMF